MRKNWTKMAIALGPLAIIASLAWEYARINPSYGFIVEPWALRGFETNHFPAFLTAGTLLLIGGIATSWEGTLRPAVSAGIVGFFVIAMTGFTFAFRSESMELSLDPGFVMGVSLIVALAVAASLKSLLGSSNAVFKRASLSMLVLFVVFYFGLSATVGGSKIDVPTGIVVLFVSLVIGGMAVSIRPMTMAANRFLIFVTVAVWGLVLFSAGALRQNLIDEQYATVQSNGVANIAVAYKDTQAAVGWWLAGFAATVAFVGAVGLWAKRRDIVAALARARKQRAAAEISAREIEEAAETYAKELEARGASAT